VDIRPPEKARSEQPQLSVPLSRQYLNIAEG
jgi:hypothetical protein